VARTAAETKIIDCNAVNRQIDKVPSGSNLSSVAYSGALTDFAAYLTGYAAKVVGTPASRVLVRISGDATTASNLAAMDNVTKPQLKLAVNKITTDLQLLNPYCK
jgi:hypothetical protein